MRRLFQRDKKRSDDSFVIIIDATGLFEDWHDRLDVGVSLINENPNISYNVDVGFSSIGTPEYGGFL